MTAQAHSSVLRQMAQVRVTATPDVPLTSSRAIRLALTRAAQNSIGLTLNVISVEEDTLSLDELAGVFSNDHLMIGLMRDDALGGLLACDFDLGSAAVEVQTAGKVMPRAPDPRPLTGVDLSLLHPMMQRLMAELELTTPRTALDGWADGATIGARFEAVRRIGFDLSDVPYRLIRLSIDFGVPDRTGTMLMAMPTQAQGAVLKPVAKPTIDWKARFQAAVLKAPATLDAVVHEFRIPLHVATSLKVGQVIALNGCTVGTVRLVAGDGQTVARAKLGQIAGQIAVRILADKPTGTDEMAEMRPVTGPPPATKELLPMAET